jgi:hypothetical protein
MKMIGQNIIFYKKDLVRICPLFTKYNSIQWRNESVWEIKNNIVINLQYLKILKKYLFFSENAEEF